MKIAVYSGTFDPITNGHMSIIKRAIGLFDKVYIAVAEETYKNTLFDVEAFHSYTMEDAPASNQSTALPDQALQKCHSHQSIHDRSSLKDIPS